MISFTFSISIKYSPSTNFYLDFRRTHTHTHTLRWLLLMMLMLMCLLTLFWKYARNNNPFVSGICVKITFSLIIISIKTSNIDSHKFYNPIFSVCVWCVWMNEYVCALCHAKETVQRNAQTIDVNLFAFKFYNSRKFEVCCKSKWLLCVTETKKNARNFLMAFVLNKCLKQYHIFGKFSAL